jgi:galactose mutarotase-like enzyme
MTKLPDVILQNDELRVALSNLGAEIRSIYRIGGAGGAVGAVREEGAGGTVRGEGADGAGGTEYIWQGDARYWADRAIHLFPYIGRLTEGSYEHRGRRYRMDIHGFLKDSEMTVVSASAHEAAFRLESSATTKEQYPFDFRIEVRYRLDAHRLHIEYRVENLGGEAMYFGLGGHPGFRVPLREGETFEDYFIEFPNAERVTRIAMSPQRFATDGRAAFPLQDGRVNLRHSLFDDDAIVLENTGGLVSLRRSSSGTGRIDIAYPDMEYLALWHTPHTDAPFVCIEPWTSLPSRDGIVEELGSQKNLVALAAHGECRRRWSISVSP